MAFNPFTWFRKHQKVVFSGLILVCMITFVASFGAGDLVHRGLALFGAGRVAGDLVATIHGRKVYERDVMLLTQQRKMASDFLLQTVSLSHMEVVNTLLKELKADETVDNPLADLRNVVEGAKTRNDRLMMLQQTLSRARTETERRSALMAFQQEFQSTLQDDAQRLRAIAARAKVKEDPAKVKTVDSVAALLAFQTWQGTQRGQEYYFGGTPRLEDLLDFVLWQHQADDLGVTLTSADVMQEITREAAGREVFEEKSFEKDRRVIDFLRAGNFARLGIGAKDLLDALTQEFRVVMAQSAVLWPDSGVRAFRFQVGVNTPGTITPDEFYHYYQDQRTTLKVKLLSIPVDKYVAEVKTSPGDPSEVELRARYDRYKDQEPRPDRREPGFKEPRRVAIEYVYASADDPYYREEAAKVVRSLEQLADPLVNVRWRTAAPAAIVPPGAGPIGWAAQFATALAYDPLQQLYEERVKGSFGWWYSEEEGGILIGEKAKRLHEKNVNRADTAAALLGSLVGAALPAGTPVAPVTALYLNATHHELRNGAVIASAVIGAHLAAPGNSEGLANVLRTASVAAALQPETPPLERVRAALLSELEEAERLRILQENLDTVAKEIEKRKGQPDQINAYLVEAVGRYRLKIQKMPEALTQTELAEKLRKGYPVLEPFEKAVYDAIREANRRQRAMELARMGRFDLFEKLNEPGQIPEPTVDDFLRVLYTQTPGLYVPVFNPLRYKDTRFIGWYNQDHPGHVLPYSDPKVQEAVLHSWKFDRARMLARKQADQIASAIASKKLTPADAERVLREQKLGSKGEPGTVFELDRVSQVVTPEREVHIRPSKEYSEYQVPEDKRELLPYPPSGFVLDLLTLQRPGDAMVIADQPVRNFYVAVLANRDEPSVKQFLDLYAKQDPLYSRFTLQRSRQYYERAMAQLRREAVPADKINEDGHYIISEQMRRQVSDRPGDSE